MPHMTAFARNQWYVAAYSHEVGRFLGRTILGETLVLYRTEEEGTPVVLHDRCVHRRYPLSEAPTRLDGDRIVCGYHGFTYDTTGTCVYVPGQKRVPRTARVASYPVVEQDSLIWVWIGDPALADPQDIPRARHLDSPGWVTVRGMEPIDCDYGLLVDNLLDLSHETYLHGGYIGTPEVAETPITTEVDEGAGIVRVSRHMDDAECPPFYAKSTGMSHHPLAGHRVPRALPVSAAQPHRPGRCAARLQRLPHRDHVRDHTVRRRQGVRLLGRLARLGDGQRRGHRVPARQQPHGLMQDVTALNLLQKTLGTERTGYQELSINIDTGGLAARRILARLVEEGEKPVEKVQ
ncbi:Vanillate O-demethylase monooxygenase subunit OS=Streptomyces violarus OX=67380 GN=FHS41_001091 PE=4 SV=1 [Streptomyces violarus]